MSAAMEATTIVLQVFQRMDDQRRADQERFEDQRRVDEERHHKHHQGMRRKDILVRIIVFAKREGHDFCEGAHTSDDCSSRVESTATSDWNQPNHGGFIDSVWRNIHSQLFANVSTLVESEAEAPEPESEYSPEEYNLGGYELEYKLDEPVATQPCPDVKNPHCHRREEVQPQLVEVRPELNKISPTDLEYIFPEGSPSHCRPISP